MSRGKEGGRNGTKYENNELDIRCLSVSAVVTAFPTGVEAQTSSPPYPVIYSTHLYYTFIMDNDDPFDATVLLKSPELDIKGAFLDNPTYPSGGEKVLGKLMLYADRRVPYVKGLGKFEMRSATDQGLYGANQEGVQLILKTLTESKQKVSLITVGSLTDFSVALQRDTKLLSEKVSTVYIVAGTMESRLQDWNVKLDPTAFVTMMRSELPIVWVPVDTSMWYFPVPPLLVSTKNKLAHFLLTSPSTTTSCSIRKRRSTKTGSSTTILACVCGPHRRL